MYKKIPRLLLLDALDLINAVKASSIDIKLDSSLEDKETQSPIAQKLEIITDIFNRIRKKYRDAYPTIEWNKIIHTRPISIDQYEVVNSETVWRIIAIHLPEVKKIINKIPLNANS
jgi:uncharacterized protein with HEPN domain